MTPLEQATILSVADELDRFSMKRSSARLRALLGERPDDERPCPIQDREAGNRLRAIPWGLAEMLYPAYGHDQTLERLAERGGFGRGEIGMLAMDCYNARRPRLLRPPLLDLYDMAKRAGHPVIGA